MKPKKYLEFKVTGRTLSNGKFEIESKVQTKRGHVSIHEHEANTNNGMVKSTKLWYEAAEEEKQESDELSLAKKKADELGVKYNAKISLENLLTKIETFQK